MSERLVIFCPRRVISIVEPTMIPETMRRTAVDTSSSIIVNPPSPLGSGETSPPSPFVRTLFITGSSERKRLERCDRGARSQRPGALRRPHRRRDGDLLEVRSHAATGRRHSAHLPDPLVVPIVLTV